MNVGLLWLDDSKRTIEDKVGRAVDYYLEKYGRLPEMCLVNQKTVSAEQTIGNVMVQPTNNVLPHHFWLGMKAS